ncbi:hypothetical protein PUNSTDRAFT_141660 [Punctularia strigosozonata HHB-11173 SS5]|uniref:uncharacterized protein n=1 Tax=Punctularia strigosozonata (strain HHB-11173) TaxID=741275 RepID=UPI0004417BB3|nr:uncharacterized protein PUNSTDRAFT_141660 [Punctularia strigosozonata HHB-11173 SS5]EIN11217.1 hypothetical protein PUNSTDRAFT_141660 [Punctularia strigosozonata HHB-11173 SS5]
MAAAKVKMNANGAHTFLEIVKVRFGTPAHLVFTFYAVLCNIVVSGSLILGGAATVNALTGMPIIAACFLLPIGIAVYVVFGGLRATFICDYAHTVVIFTIIYLFVFRAYGTAEDIGSPSSMYDLLTEAAKIMPVTGNEHGSYLTMKSNQGLVFAAAGMLTGLSGVFCDQGYWQRAIASAPESTTKAYMLGGLSWFAVPWAFASCLGLAARALLTNPKFPTYPNPLSASQASAGLAAPAAAAVLMGKGGAVAILLVVFMAVTSAASAELIAVSSIFSYDLYRVYWRKAAGGAEIVRVSHWFIVFWAIWMGAWSAILNRASIDLGWLYYVQGAVLSPAVIPVALTVGWSRLTATGVLWGSIVGAILAVLAWMIGCLKIYGSINITNLALPYSAICSGVTGLLFSGVITVVVSLLGHQRYDFAGTRAIAVVDPVDEEDSGVQGVPAEREDSASSSAGGQEKNAKDPEAGNTTVTTIPVASETMPPFSSGGTRPPASPEVLQAVYKKAAWMALALTLCVTIIVPLPMFFSHYVFSKSFFTFWIACTIIWAFLSGTFCIVLPVIESRRQILTIARASFKALRFAGRGDHTKA